MDGKCMYTALVRVASAPDGEYSGLMHNDTIVFMDDNLNHWMVRWSMPIRGRSAVWIRVHDGKVSVKEKTLCIRVHDGKNSVKEKTL